MKTFDENLRLIWDTQGLSVIILGKHSSDRCQIIVLLRFFEYNFLCVTSGMQVFVGIHHIFTLKLLIHETKHLKIMKNKKKLFKIFQLQRKWQTFEPFQKTSQITNNMENPVVIWDTTISLRIRLWEIQKQRIIKGSLINYIKNNIDRLYQLYFGT